MRLTSIEQLFQAFSGGTPEKLRAYVLAAEKLSPRDLAVATVRLIERWTKTTIPPFAVLRETTLQIAGERLSQGTIPQMTSEQTRALVIRRLEALKQDPSGERAYGTVTRIDPHDERWIKLHWEQFRETFHWPAYMEER